MNRIKAIALLTIASFGSASHVLAATGAVQATVPFNFNVGSRVLPAGTYRIESGSSNIITLQNRNGKSAASTLVYAADSDGSSNGKLVFNKYGNQYFLSKVLCPAAAVSAVLPVSKLEKRVRVQEASIHTQGETLVATR
jgi:hypothetical protein